MSLLIPENARLKAKLRRTIILPLPTQRLASSALRSLSVDAELSPLVRRSFTLTSTTNASIAGDAELRLNGNTVPMTSVNDTANENDIEVLTVLKTKYKATTNRMLRVAVNGFMESLGVVLGVMEELDVDVLEEGLK